MAIFEKHFEVGWRDVDPNGHVANMAYLEYAVDTRRLFRFVRISAAEFPEAWLRACDQKRFCRILSRST
jgi:acyl-CoA thioesterase FadM